LKKGGQVLKKKKKSQATRALKPIERTGKIGGQCREKFMKTIKYRTTKRGKKGKRMKSREKKKGGGY